MKITLKQLEVFAAVAKTGNMTQAALELHLTQSACSMSLSSLESQLNGPLFDRHGKKLVLNERGKILFSKSANIITQVNELQDLMLGKKEQTLSGTLVIGASTTIGNYVLPSLIGKFIKRHSESKLKLRISDTDHVIDELLKFNIDIGLIEGVCRSEDIEIIPWKQDELIVIAPNHHSLTKLKKITLDDLKSADWVLREPGSATRNKFEETLGIPLTPLFELNHTEAIKQAVISGLGISCVSKNTVMESLKKGELIELKIPFLKLTRQYSILLHKEKYQSHLLIELMKFISNYS